MQNGDAYLILGQEQVTQELIQELAVNRQQDGTFGLTCDWWDGHVEREVGAKFGRLLQLYGVCKAQAEARRKGYTTRRQTLGDGSIKLVIGGVA